MSDENQLKERSARKLYYFILPAILGAMSLLLFWGIHRESFFSQSKFWGLSLIVFTLITMLKFRIDDLRGISTVFYILLIIILLGLLFSGASIRGSSRWIFVSELSIQPSELIKPIFVLFVSSIIAKVNERRIKDYLLTIIYVSIPCLLVLLQPDLGSSLVIGLTGSLLIFLSRFPKRWLSFLGISLLVFIFIFNRFFIADYQKNRIDYFLHPESDPLGKGYNLIQAKIAVGSGLIFGKGIGFGGQTRLEFLPEKNTDFVFASLGESFGFLGVSIAIAVFFIIFTIAFRQSLKAENEFSFLVKSGLGFYLWLQTVINIGMNLGLMPITGIPLPFLSAGGSSLLSSTIALALILK